MWRLTKPWLFHFALREANMRERERGWPVQRNTVLPTGLSWNFPVAAARPLDISKDGFGWFSYCGPVASPETIRVRARRMHPSIGEQLAMDF